MSSLQRLFYIWERTDYSDPFGDIVENLVGLYTEEAKDRFMAKVKPADPNNFSLGYFVKEAKIIT